ncbi:MAG: nucleoside transporter C-terminal domain-containing protein [Bryobacteraceae bacterium]
MPVPETADPNTGEVKVEIEKPGERDRRGARGASDGLQLALNVGGMLIAFLALIAMLNGIFGWAHAQAAWFPESMQQMLGWALAPVAWLLGVPWKDAAAVGNLMGTRLILNEFVAFAQLGPPGRIARSEITAIATYALCGFANLEFDRHSGGRHRSWRRTGDRPREVGAVW